MPERSRSGAFSTSDDCRIVFTLHAARKPAAGRIALIHPLAMSGALWQGVTDILTEHVDVLTYDCRGHGQSGRAAGPYTTDLFARDLMELFDHVGWSAAMVAGCSMGGCVAQAAAGNYPRRVLGLGLIDTTAWYGPDAPQSWHERAIKARTEGLPALLDFQKTRWFSDGFREQHPDVVEALTYIFVGNDIECYAATCAMLGAADLRPLQASMRLPTAIVVGDEDYATPVAMARQLHAGIAGSTLAILPKIRHFSLVQAPEMVAAHMLHLADNVMKQDQQKTA